MLKLHSAHAIAHYGHGLLFAAQDDLCGDAGSDAYPPDQKVGNHFQVGLPGHMDLVAESGRNRSGAESVDKQQKSSCYDEIVELLRHSSWGSANADAVNC